MKKKTIAVTATMSLLASLGLASCSGSEQQSDQVVTWYTDYDPEESAPLIEKFTQETGIAVEQYNGSSADVVARLLSEDSAGATKADVVTFAGVEAEARLREAGVFAPLPESVQNNLPDQPEQFTDPTGYWFSMSSIVIAIAYNTTLVEEGQEPEEYTDFLDPQWKGNFNIPVSTNSTSVISYYMMAQDPGLGKEFLSALGENEPVVISKSGDQAGNIVRGEQAAGFFNDYVAWKQIATGAPLAVVYPSDGVTTMHDYTALISDAPHEDAATKWLEFLATEEAGQILSDSMGRYSTYTNVKSSPEERPELSELTLIAAADTEELLAAQTEFAPFLAEAFHE